MAETLNTSPIALQNITKTIGNIECHLLLNSDSGYTIINMSLAKHIMFNYIQTKWSEKKPLEPNDIVETLGTLKAPVSLNDSKIPKAKFTVVADGFRSILGRGLFDQLGITISQNFCQKTN